MIRTRSSAIALAAVLALACCPRAFAADPERGVSGSVWIEEGYTDNVREEAALHEEAWYTGVGAEGVVQRKPRGWLPHRFGALARFRVYGEFPKRDYAEFGPMLGYDWKPVAVTVACRYSPNHLEVDPASSEPAFADITNLPLELRTKFGPDRSWTGVLRLESEWQHYEPLFGGRTFFEEAIEAGIRFHTKTPVTPRASVTYAIRDANSSNFDRQEVALLVGFDADMPAGIRLIFRYEQTWRDFLAGSANDSTTGKRNSNFQRDDQEYVFETGLDVPVQWIAGTSLQLRYRHETNDSTREDRTYDVNEARMRVLYEFE
jgi:hypothetical protein